MAKNEKDKQTNNYYNKYDTTYKTKELATRTPPKRRVISGRARRSCSTFGTRRVAYVITNPVNSLIR